MFSCVLPRPILPAEPMLSSLSWLLRVCRHSWNFLLENLALSNDSRNNCLQEKPRLLSKESEPYCLQPQEAITVEDDGTGSLACAYKWCTCVIIVYICGEGVGGWEEGRGSIFFFDLVMCLTSTWHLGYWQESKISPPLESLTGVGSCWMFHFSQKKRFSPSSLFLELEMFQKPTGSIKLWCLVVVLYFSVFKNL